MCYNKLIVIVRLKINCYSNYHTYYIYHCSIIVRVFHSKTNKSKFNNLHNISNRIIICATCFRKQQKHATLLNLPIMTFTLEATINRTRNCKCKLHILRKIKRKIMTNFKSFSLLAKKSTIQFLY